ncbi:189_t:CDS:2, partial [Gigaspora rosea]
ENNLVKVKYLYGTDDMNPFEWFDDFERASEANNWTKDRMVKIASRYLKEMAAIWYKAIKESIKYWKMELYELRQKDTEKVDIYATKFTKLLNRINVDNGFSDGFIVGMFLNGLKVNNATLVSVAAPKNLNEAIAAAKRVEAEGNY